MRTTIQVQQTIKHELDNLKVNPRETYEDVITRLVQMLKENALLKTKLLSEGYTEMAEDSKKIAEEWLVTEINNEI
jgi:hypothetical protein